MAESPRLNLRQTPAHPCSYLPAHSARMVFVESAFPLTPEIYSSLSEIGFRRSGEHIYRPHCAQCSACIPLRIPIHSFQPTRQQRRAWQRNQDLTILVSEDIRSGEHYALYEKYIRLRHADGDMFPPTPQQYEAFLANPSYDQDHQITHYVEFRLNNRLLGVAVTDILPAGTSAIYTFFDPDESQRSLGVFSVLFQIELTRRLALPHLYLGYWVEGSRKMRYKSLYQPHELYRDGRWTTAQ